MSAHSVKTTTKEGREHFQTFPESESEILVNISKTGWLSKSVRKSGSGRSRKQMAGDEKYIVQLAKKKPEPDIGQYCSDAACANRQTDINGACSSNYNTPTRDVIAGVCPGPKDRYQGLLWLDIYVKMAC